MSVEYCGMQHSVVSHYIQEAVQQCVALNFLRQLDRMEQTKNEFRILMGKCFDKSHLEYRRTIGDWRMDDENRENGGSMFG
jgi:hypothetical protein